MFAQLCSPGLGCAKDGRKAPLCPQLGVILRCFISGHHLEKKPFFFFFFAVAKKVKTPSLALQLLPVPQ